MVSIYRMQTESLIIKVGQLDRRDFHSLPKIDINRKIFNVIGFHKSAIDQLARVLRPFSVSTDHHLDLCGTFGLRVKFGTKSA
jgi:hypothetical protein